MMSYNYQEQRKNIFTEDGQVLFLKIRDRMDQLLKVAGAVRLRDLLTDVTGDSWDMLACVDRLVELGEICEITGRNVAAQDRVFVRHDG